MKHKKSPLALIAGLITIGIVIGVVMTSNFETHSTVNAFPNEGSIYTENDIKTINLLMLVILIQIASLLILLKMYGRQSFQFIP